MGEGEKLQGRGDHHFETFDQFGFQLLAISQIIYSKVGYVPRSYLEIEGLSSEGRQNNSQVFMGAPLLQQGFSFSSVDYSSTSIDFHPLEPIPEGVTVHFPPQSPPDLPKVAS